MYFAGSRTGQALPIGTIELMGSSIIDGDERFTLLIRSSITHELRTGSLSSYIDWKEAITKSSPHLFSLSLIELMAADPNAEQVPRLLQSLVGELRRRKDQKLFQTKFKPGRSVVDLKSARALFSGSIPSDLTQIGTDCLAGLLEMWLQDMPVPLFPFDLFETVTGIMTGSHSETDRRNGLRQVVASMDPIHKATLSYLIAFLREFEAAPTIGEIFGPLTLREAGTSVSGSKHRGAQVLTLRTLIEGYEEVFMTKPLERSDRRRRDTMSEVRGGKRGVRTLSMVAGAMPVSTEDPYAHPVEGVGLVATASNGGSLEDIQWLLNNGEDVMMVDDAGHSALHWAAHRNAVDIGSVLLQAVHLRDSLGETALHEASRQGHVAFCSLLLKSHADIEAMNNDGLSPVNVAAVAGQEKTLQLLIASGADLKTYSKTGETLLHSAVRGSDYRVVAFLIKSGCDVEAKNATGNTPLHFAARLGRHKATAILISPTLGSAKVNVRNNQGETPLHKAAVAGDGKLLKMLLDVGADACLRSSGDSLPLHVACGRGNLSAVIYLIERGGAAGDVDQVDEQGRTALSLAPPAIQARISEMNKLEQSTPPIAPQADDGDDEPQAVVLEDAAPKMWKSAMKSEDLDLLGTVEKSESLEEEVELSTLARTTGLKPEWEIDPAELSMGELIGKGGYGEVFRGHWLGTEVAIKKLLVTRMKPSDIAEFRSEVAVMSMLRHPNICLFMGAVTEGPNMMIVTEFMPNGSLFKVLRQKDLDYTWPLLVSFALGTARGMNYLHRAKPAIIHRDLKSLNILVDENCHVKVCDFGLTKVKSNAYLQTRVGTTQWMAPEVLSGERYNEKADIYSFGIILWEMYTRRAPYRGLNPVQVAMQVVNGLRPTLPESCPAPLRSLMTDCWHSDPSARPSFDQIIQRLSSM